MKRLAKIILTVLVVFACLIPVSAKGTWKHGAGGWWYDYGYGLYEKDSFKVIDGKTYCFDEKGYMKTGWQLRPHSDDMSQYYFRSSGELASCEWVEGNKWINLFGALERDEWVDNYRYYVDSSGNWDPSKGTRKTGWKKDNKGWWFDLGDGTYAQDGFYEIDRAWYWFDASGYMKTGWVDDGYAWSYMGNDGAMRMSQWIGEYYVDEYGCMAVSSFVDNFSVYVDKDGKRTPGWKKDAKGWWFDMGKDGYIKNVTWKIDDIWYSFDANGYMQTGWFEKYGNWHYADSTGNVYHNRWCGDYWLDENGNMATNQWVDGGRYYVGADGKWVPGAK